MPSRRKIFILTLLAWFYAGPAAAELKPAAGPVSQIRVEDLAQPAPHRRIEAEAVSKISGSAGLSSPQLKPSAPSFASLSFSWNMPVALAVFKRDNNVWIVFDRPQKIDTAALKEAAGDLAADIIQFPHPGATVLAFRPLPDVKLNVRKEGLLWVIDLFTDKLPPQTVKDMTIFTQYDSLNRPYLFIPSESFGNPVMVMDPNVGDIITIAPNSDIGFGFTAPYFYPEFTLLEAAQGMALVIKSPDIALRRGNTGLTLQAADRGLNISEDLEQMKRQQLFKENADSLQTFDIKIDPSLLKLPYAEAVEQLKQEIMAADPEDKNRARLQLAKYYIAKGLGTNALYILNQMQKAGIREVNSDKFHALLGVANFLTRRYAEAEANFEHGQLPAINEAVFWRTLASAAREFRQEDNAVLFSYLTVIRDYPPELKDQIALIGAKTALQAGDDLAAQNFIDILRSGSDRLKNRDAEISYLQAKKLELQGYPRNAIKEYRRISAMNDPYYSSLARFDNVVLSQPLGLMKLTDAINELEMLGFAWGETDFKWRLRSKLADLYVKNHDYYNALRTLRENLPISTPSQKALLNNRMLGWFEDIYLNNQADNSLTAVKSLALYNDFSWLAGKSRYRNKIIQKLADRLVAVDLLPRAAKLLKELLTMPDLSIEDRGKVGARLAIIHLFERDSVSALQMLDDTEDSRLSPELQAHRRVIRARTLANLGDIDAALLLLSDDFGKNSLLLQTDIFWNGRQWDRASETLKYLVEKPVPGQPLSNEQINYILDWATALKKAGKETVLVRLRNKFLPYFADTKYHSAFNILTSHLENDKIDLRAVNEVINDVAAYSDFAKIYNDSLKNIDLK